MKEILRQLLLAEETGRRNAAESEAAGKRLLRQAESESEEAVRHIREDARQQIEHRKQLAEKESRKQSLAVSQAAAGEIQQLQDASAKRRPAAVERVVRMLLGED